MTQPRNWIQDAFSMRTTQRTQNYRDDPKAYAYAKRGCVRIFREAGAMYLRVFLSSSTRSRKLHVNA